MNSCLVTHDGSALNLHFHITAAVTSPLKKNPTFNLDSVHHGGNASSKHAHFKMCIKTDKVVFRIADMWSDVVRLNHFQPVRSEPSVTPSCSGQGRGNEARQGRGNKAGQGRGNKAGQGPGNKAGQGYGNKAGQGRGNEAGQTSPCSCRQEARETILEERLG